MKISSPVPRRDGEGTVIQSQLEKSDGKFGDDSSEKELAEFVVEK